MASERKPNLKQTEVGMFPADWEVKEIQNVGEVIGGGTPSTKNKQYWAGKIAWITPKDLSNHKSRYITNGERNITEEGLQQSSAKILTKGAVLLTTRAPVGYLAIAENEVTTNQGFHSIIPKENTTTLFLYYLLKRNVEYLKSNSSGTTFGELSGSRLKSLKFAFPSLIEQQAIAKILSDLDSKIELNQQMNKTFEAIGQAVFKRWFADFEFPNEEGKPYKSSGGEIVDSENEEIPRGWVISSLDQLHHKNENCVITGPFGSNLHASDYREAGTPLILVKHVKNGRISGEDMPLVGNHKFPEMNRYILKIGDIVFTRVAVVGESSYIRKRNENWMISGQMLRVRANRNKISPRYLAQVFQQKIFKDQVSNYAVGSTRPSLNTKLLLSFKFVLPPLILQDRFALLLENADALIENNLNQIDTLTSIRDLLLPKLMSGKIRVPINEENVEAT